MDRRKAGLCEVCGNELAVLEVRCPYCGTERTPSQQKTGAQVLRTVNLEKGMPPVREALQRMHREINAARQQGERGLLFIHGYGASGKGGAIREEVRRQLHFLIEKKEINDFIAGEDCDRRSPHFRQAVRRFPALRKLMNKPNPGIAVVIL